MKIKDNELLRHYHNGMLDSWCGTYSQTEDEYKHSYRLGYEMGSNIDENSLLLSEEELLKLLKNEKV